VAFAHSSTSGQGGPCKQAGYTAVAFQKGSRSIQITSIVILCLPKAHQQNIYFPTASTTILFPPRVFCLTSRLLTSKRDLKERPKTLMKNRWVFQRKGYAQVRIFLWTGFLWPAFHRAHSQAQQQWQGNSSPLKTKLKHHKNNQLRFQQPSEAREELASEDVYDHTGSVTASDQRSQTAAQLQAAVSTDMKQKSVSQG